MTKQESTRLDNVVKRSELSALNKSFVLFCKMFGSFDWGIITCNLRFKVVGIRPMAPVLNTGSLEGI